MAVSTAAWERPRGWVWGESVGDDSPRLSHLGPVEFSTGTSVAVSPLFSWDVNGYYREMGVHWRATRPEIRRAYLARNGQSDARLTFIFKQLLNRDVRAAYDRCEPGTRFLDPYVIAEAKQAALRRSATERGVDPDALREALAKMGFQVDDTPETEEVLDSAQEQAEHSECPARAEMPTPWPYAYYRWRSTRTSTDRLAQWQELLVRAFADRGITTTLAVGHVGRVPHDWLIARVGYRTVVFLNHNVEQPTAEMAQAVADRVVNDQQEASGLRSSLL